MWDEQPYMYYERTEEVPTVEFDSWWEIQWEGEKLVSRTVYEGKWETMRFPTRIEAIKYQRNHPEEFPAWVHVVINCKSKQK